ncbi:CU044_2847 family protein [Streptomyces naphthomycinicus]|uniref:CU044_2847 family protein n=1 Tax=Streptomyces naphthomycinicus TaxID=2872625 RepID=UPI001CEDD5F5|nr:CU044_2847 family protein [Streptomyces sp. TML10]
MQGLVRVPLEGGGAILVQEVKGAPESDAPESGGPVKAGRIGDAVRDLPRTLQESLVPVREAARAVLEQLSRTGSQTVEVEFGVNLAAKSGVVITSGEAAVHLKVRVTWEKGESGDSRQDTP